MSKASAIQRIIARKKNEYIRTLVGTTLYHRYKSTIEDYLMRIEQDEECLPKEVYDKHKRNRTPDDLSYNEYNKHLQILEECFETYAKYFKSIEDEVMLQCGQL